jgi:hypothetical protein
MYHRSTGVGPCAHAHRRESPPGGLLALGANQNAVWIVIDSAILGWIFSPLAILVRKE